jgi:hypothetical protein
MQSSFSVERQLPFNFTASASFLYMRSLHLLRSRNLSAPLPGAEARPAGDGGNIPAYESSGIHKRRQLIIGVNKFGGGRLNLFGNYILNQARSDTDGAETFPLIRNNRFRSPDSRSICNRIGGTIWMCPFRSDCPMITGC